jgi:hypothetical protein
MVRTVVKVISGLPRRVLHKRLPDLITSTRDNYKKSCYYTTANSGVINRPSARTHVHEQPVDLV